MERKNFLMKGRKIYYLIQPLNLEILERVLFFKMLIIPSPLPSPEGGDALKTFKQASPAPLSFYQFFMERVPKAGEGFIFFQQSRVRTLAHRYFSRGNSQITSYKQWIASSQIITYSLCLHLTLTLSWIIRASITFQ